jgi:nicotinamide mononucleotide transporter
MQFIFDFFSVHNLVGSPLGYDLSWIELLATLFNAACVFLAAKRSKWTWYIGMVAVTLMAIMFYQFQLYPDFTLNLFFYLPVQFIGLWFWTRPKNQAEDNKIKSFQLSNKTRLILLVISLVLYIGVSIFYTYCNVLLPKFYPEPSSYPWVDSSIMVYSIIAQILMMKQFDENWIIWIIVNIIATTLYFVKGINLVAIEYILFTANAVYGYINWNKSKQLQSYEQLQDSIGEM